MSSDKIFTNGRIVTRDAEFDGTVVVRDGRIVEVAPGPTACATAIDLEGDYLVPGLVELHTDNMEKHFAPRPGVQWPSLAAVMAHDTQIAAAGITTVFDSLSLGDVRGDTDRVKNRARMVEAICAVSERRLSRAEHRLHLRFVPHVSQGGHGALPAAADFLGNGLRVFGLRHVVDDHVGRGLAKRDRDRATDTGVGAGHQRGLAFEQLDRLHGRDHRFRQIHVGVVAFHVLPSFMR